MQQLHQPIVLAIAVCSSSQPNRRRLPCSSQQLQTPVPPPLAATFCLATCRARRPFHPGRLWDFLRSYWVLQQVESLGEEEEEEAGEEEEEGKAGGKRPATDDKRQAVAAGGAKGEKGGAAASAPASGRGGSGQEPAGGDASGDGSGGAGLVIVAEDVSAAEAAARQAELKRRFGQVRPPWGQACWG